MANRLNVYGQKKPKDQVVIAGTRDSLLALKASIDRVVAQMPMPGMPAPSTPNPFTEYGAYQDADGQAFELVVRGVTDATLDILPDNNE